MQLRYGIYLSNSCICFIDWRSTQLHLFSLFCLATCSLNTNSSFLQLSTGSECFKIIKSNVLVCKKLCFCRLLMIKSSENATRHCTYFLFSIKTDPILGKFQIYGREMYPTQCEAGLTWLFQQRQWLRAQPSSTWALEPDSVRSNSGSIVTHCATLRRSVLCVSSITWDFHSTYFQGLFWGLHVKDTWNHALNIINAQ